MSELSSTVFGEVAFNLMPVISVVPNSLAPCAHWKQTLKSFNTRQGFLGTALGPSDRLKQQDSHKPHKEVENETDLMFHTVDMKRPSRWHEKEGTGQKTEKQRNQGRPPAAEPGGDHDSDNERAEREMVSQQGVEQHSDPQRDGETHDRQRIAKQRRKDVLQRFASKGTARTAAHKSPPIVNGGDNPLFWRWEG